MHSLFKFIKAASFFPRFASNVRGWRWKIPGKNSKGNPCTFTPEDKQAIAKGLRKMVEEYERGIGG